jgi:DNA/RNA endonuclease YhcR with UshA esterase domain
MTEQESTTTKRPVRGTRLATLALLAVSLTSATSCGDAGGGDVTTISATGLVTGLVFFDGNGSRVSDDGDSPLAGVDVALVLPQVLDTVRRTTSDANGLFTFTGVPVGDYRIVVDTNTIGDSTVVALITPALISLAPNDTTDVDIAISFPLLTTEEARDMPVGMRMFVVGIALNDAFTFGDSTVHVADTLGSLRAIRSGPGSYGASDSIRLRGAIATRNGQPVLDLDRTVPAVLAPAELPIRDTVTTAVAANANGGLLDAALVQVDSARVGQSTTVGNDLVFTIDDGTGALELVLDGDIGFNLGPFLVPGAYLNVTGLLVPTDSGTWQLKPRGEVDVDLIIPLLSIAAARTRPAGEIVFVDGIVLNEWDTFGDSTLHISDTSAALRGVQVRRSTTFPGDSIRFIGTLATRNGQPVLDRATVFFLDRVGEPDPVTVTTAAAASANGGTLDAALVKIDSARISDTATVNGDFVAAIEDGTGQLELVLDGDITFNLGSFFVPGAIVEVTGVLVPTGSGTWQIKPRSELDVELTVPLISIAQARTRPAGEIVFVDGTVLNDWGTFADSTVHISDISSTIRGIQVRPPSFPLTWATGDNVRFVGEMVTHLGQPVINDAALFPLGGFTLPPPVNLATAEATTARDGTLDAALVAIRNAIITATGAVGGDYHLTVDDGSGQVVVVLDKDSGFNLSSYVPGVILNVTGLLVPTGSGTWRVKPRSENDVFIIL